MPPSLVSPELVDAVTTAILEANGGDRPASIWQWRRVLRRFGVATWRILPAAELESPFLRSGALIIPRTRHQQQLEHWLVHESAEAALLHDGHAPMNAPEDRHAVACEVEALWFEPGRCPGKKAPVVSTADRWAALEAIAQRLDAEERRV